MTPAVRAVRAARAALDLVFPGACVGCAAPGPGWCLRCAREVRRSGPLHLDEPSPGIPLLAAAPHSGPARRLLLSVKEHGRGELRPVLADLLLAPLDELDELDELVGDRDVVLVPIPSRRSAVRARGGDLVADLAARAALRRRRAGAATRVRRGLQLRRRVRDQTDLDATGRRRNLEGAMLARGVDGLSVVLLDDVVTTGATCREGVRSLLAAGAKVRGAVCVTAAAGPVPAGSPDGWSRAGPDAGR